MKVDNSVNDLEMNKETRNPSITPSSIFQKFRLKVSGSATYDYGTKTGRNWQIIKKVLLCMILISAISCLIFFDFKEELEEKRSIDKFLKMLNKLSIDVKFFDLFAVEKKFTIFNFYSNFTKELFDIRAKVDNLKYKNNNLIESLRNESSIDNLLDNFTNFWREYQQIHISKLHFLELAEEYQQILALDYLMSSIYNVFLTRLISELLIYTKTKVMIHRFNVSIILSQENINYASKIVSKLDYKCILKNVDALDEKRYNINIFSINIYYFLISKGYF